ncbi:MAG: hypothetical protein ABF293_08260 [Flavobacteriaceae bacterium]
MNTAELPLDYKQFEKLAGIQQPFCVSIYLPMYKSGKEQNEGLGPAQLKSALHQVEKELIAQGMSGPEIKSYVAPAKELITDLSFWRNPSEGVAIYLNQKNGVSIFKTPLKHSPLVYVNDHFYLVPILTLFESDNRVFLLQLSQDYVKLARADKYTFEELNIDEFIPSQLEETVGFDYKQKMLQFRTGHAVHGAGSFHGHGEGKDDDQKEILSFFREIDKNIRRILKPQNATLIIACVDELFPLYKKANTFKNLYPAHISGDPESIDKQRLQSEFHKLIHTINTGIKNDLVGRYTNLVHTPKTSHQISEIVPAAIDGRIEILFLRREDMVFGTYNVKNKCVILDADSTPRNQCLVNLAAVQTILQGGKVYNMETDQMPEAGRPLNALHRY